MLSDTFCEENLFRDKRHEGAELRCLLSDS
jgi:hypothetical protein